MAAKDDTTTSGQGRAAVAAVAGATAGLVSRVCIAPLDVVKIRLQTQAHIDPAGARQAPKYRNVGHTFRLIVQEEGLRALWKGNVAAMLLYTTYGAVQFATYRQMQTFLGSYTSTNHLRSAVASFASGAMAGAVAITLTYPFDMFRTRFSLQGQHKTYTGIMQAFRHTWAHDGFRGFYGGLLPTVLQIVPYMGMMYYSYEVLKMLTDRLVSTVPAAPDSTGETHWVDYKHWFTKDIQKTLCGGAAGLLSKAGAMPFDVVRKRLQIQHSEAGEYVVGGMVNYQNLRDCVKRTYQAEGVRGFYRGLTPAILKTAPASAITFLVFENTSEWLTRLIGS